MQADQCLLFHCRDSRITLTSMSKIKACSHLQWLYRLFLCQYLLRNLEVRISSDKTQLTNVNMLLFVLVFFLSIFLYVLTPEGDIRRVPGNQVLGVIKFFCISFCSMLVVLVVIERKASACLIMLSAKQGSHWYHF